ncbi:MAG: hypothetical protein ACI4E3_02635 [Candidatus Fimousia sp.]
MINNLAKVIKVLFKSIPIKRILSLDEKIQMDYDRIDIRYIRKLLLEENGDVYSDTEIQYQIAELLEQYQGKTEENPRDIHVFALMFSYLPNILVFYENKVVCKYNRLLEWNDIVRVIGEDFPVIARLVVRDCEQRTETSDFCWPPVIGHNNKQLQRILDRGMAENHFHLRGSSPYFNISWMNLMNHPGEYNVLNRFDSVEANYRNIGRIADRKSSESSLKVLVVRAALIRLYLSCKLIRKPIRLREYMVPIREISKYLSNSKEIPEELLKNRMISLEMCRDYLEGSDFDYLWKKETIRTLNIFLDNEYEMHINTENIQRIINGMMMDGLSLDYMLKFVPDVYRRGEEEYRILAGERWFLYQMLRCIYTDDRSFTKREYNLFYAYLRIKNEVRYELVQTNRVVGFENFEIYQSRKDLFAHMDGWKRSEGRLVRLAVRDVLNNEAVKSLEVRIAPEKSARDMADTIKEYDWAIIKAYYDLENSRIPYEDIFKDYEGDDRMEDFPQDDLRRKFYYVFHFIKKADRDPSADEGLFTFECRHYRLRKEIKKIAYEILQFRRLYPQYARRVMGIDACAQELGCRPEVFAQVFRILKNYVDSYFDYINDFTLPQLKITYHVGEEFLDIVDGLRAIDEAIRFLNLDCGDRLGHAIALGVDVKQWYKLKGKKINISLQDFLDNIVWLHHALIKYKIPDMSSLKGWLEETYSHYFNYIYQNGQKSILTSVESLGNYMKGKFDINTYYLSWLLRGDKPSMYKTEKFQYSSISEIDQWDRYAVNRRKDSMTKDDIRNIPEVSLLYHLYHYDIDARIRGMEKKTITLPDIYIEGVMKVQKAFQKEIVDMGLSIETNPSSNVNISAINGYEEHPISNFYNYGLTINEEELNACPQINVSINTDDKGVFNTRLENEYALLACAMENVKNPDGTNKYKREFIYEWLDNVRKMGLRQIFNENYKYDLM